MTPSGPFSDPKAPNEPSSHRGSAGTLRIAISSHLNEFQAATPHFIKNDRGGASSICMLCSKVLDVGHEPTSTAKKVKLGAGPRISQTLASNLKLLKLISRGVRCAALNLKLLRPISRRVRRAQAPTPATAQDQARARAAQRTEMQRDRSSRDTTRRVATRGDAARRETTRRTRNRTSFASPMASRNKNHKITRRKQRRAPNKGLTQRDMAQRSETVVSSEIVHASKLLNGNHEIQKHNENHKTALRFATKNGPTPHDVAKRNLSSFLQKIIFFHISKGNPHF